MKPLASSYWSPKYHVSLSPIVRHTRSNKSLPVDFHCITGNWSVCALYHQGVTRNNIITIQRNCDTHSLTSRLNSSSASKVQILTGKDLPDFFLRNGDILFLIVVLVWRHERHAADRYREGTRSYDRLDFALLLKNILVRRRYFPRLAPEM